MKFSWLVLSTDLVVMATLLFAGCLDSVPSTSPMVTPPTTSSYAKIVGAATITAVPQTTPAVVKATQVPVQIFSGNYHWAEYRKNITQTLPPNPRSQWEETERIEVSDTAYKGIPAVRNKITTTLDYHERVDNIPVTTKGGWIVVGDYYYDAATGRFLGGTETNTIKGESKPATEYTLYERDREDGPWREMGIMPFAGMNITLVDQGTRPVTVPAGRYPDARKYAGNFRDGTPISFWVSPGVPVPVQYQFPNKFLDGIDPIETFELRGWE